MKKFVRRSLALLIAGAVPFAAVIPATATTLAEIDYTFDCDALEPYSDYHVPITSNGSVTVTLVNCDGTYISDTTNGNSAPGTDAVSTADGVVTNNAATYLVQHASEDITFTAEATILFYAISGDTESAFIALLATEPTDLTNPEGSKLISSTAVLPMNPSEFTITDGIFDGGGDILLNGNETCDLEPGSHVYTVKRFHVTTAGTYTFRFLGTVPAGIWVDFNEEWNPLVDPMVAMYHGEFDPQNPGARVSGCNDDLNDYSDLNGVDWTNTDNSWALTEESDLIYDTYPYFVESLQPGDYSFVFTTYGAYSATDWANGDDVMFGIDWTPQDFTIDYDVWGPTAGIAEVEHFALASTGVDPSFALWSGLALVGTGAGIAAARRRAQRD